MAGTRAEWAGARRFNTTAAAATSGMLDQSDQTGQIVIMPKEFSVYEAKKRLSEILRGVRERRETYVVTYHGEPIAEIRPIEPPATGTFEDRLNDLRARGILVPPKEKGPFEFKPVAHRPGALQRFLDERD